MEKKKRKQNSSLGPEPVSADHYYHKQPEPLQGCLLALKHIILAHDAHITHGRLFQIPFFWYKGYKLAFLWVHRKKLLLGLVEDLKLIKAEPGLRRRNKYETLEIDPAKDIPVKTIAHRLQQYIDKYDKFIQKDQNPK